MTRGTPGPGAEAERSGDLDPATGEPRPREARDPDAVTSGPPAEELAPPVEPEAEGPGPEGESPEAGSPSAAGEAPEAGAEARPAREAVGAPDRPAGPSGPAGAGDRPTLEERFRKRYLIRLPARHNPKLAALVERMNEDDELYALWTAANVTAVDRLRMSDHGPVHVQIVANSALRLLRLLVDAGVTPGIVFDYGLEPTDAEVVVSLAALFHDVGMSIHRDGHEAYSLFVAQPVLDRLLAEVYRPPAAAIIRSEILHAIICHRAGGRPLTVEAGILRIADALDMAQGRSRIPFRAGSMSIHSVSAAAVEAIDIDPGEETAVRIRIRMSNSAGVFQVDQLLREKLRGSGLEEHIQVEAEIEGETEKRLVTRFRL